MRQLLPPGRAGSEFLAWGYLIWALFYWQDSRLWGTYVTYGKIPSCFGWWSRVITRDPRRRTVSPLSYSLRFGLHFPKQNALSSNLIHFNETWYVLNLGQKGPCGKIRFLSNTGAGGRQVVGKVLVKSYRQPGKDQAKEGVQRIPHADG